MARDDLRAIIRYIGKDSAVRAGTFGREILLSTMRLVEHPELGRPGRSPGSRELVVHRNYVIVYRMATNGRVVEILRVKHAAQQVP